MTSNEKKVRIILPGGGVKGVFQLGVLSEIFKNKNYIIDAVYGCSIGAVLSPFAANKNIDDAIKIFNDIKNIDDVVEKRTFCGFKLPSWKLILAYFAFTKLGAYKSFKIVQKILDSLSDIQLEVAKSKCHVVAYDILNNKEEWFTGDKLTQGIKCSSALWLAVPPINYDNTYYSDGGVSELFPIDYILKHDDATSFDGIYLFIDCDTRILNKNDVPKDGLTFMNIIHWGAASQLAENELDKLKKTLDKKLHIIKPEYNIITHSLDIDQDKMKRAFDYGCDIAKQFCEKNI
jgi:predicted acylesterase/phospholipase RssA